MISTRIVTLMVMFTVVQLITCDLYDANKNKNQSFRDQQMRNSQKPISSQRTLQNSNPPHQRAIQKTAVKQFERTFGSNPSTTTRSISKTTQDNLPDRSKSRLTSQNNNIIAAEPELKTNEGEQNTPKKGKFRRAVGMVIKPIFRVMSLSNMFG